MTRAPQTPPQSPAPAVAPGTPPTACCSLTERGTEAELPATGDGFGDGTSRPHDAIPVRGGRSFVGTDAPVFKADGEGPRRKTVLRDFALEATTVTNARFAEFVEATGYVSDAERFGWSIVFAGLLPQQAKVVATNPDTPWWSRVEGACWSHPEGPGSGITDRQDHPVTHVSWSDARAFADWVGGRLPSEAEWEHAARGGNNWRKFPWGDEEPDDRDTILCNIWQGRFPVENTLKDGYLGTAPARSFAPSDLGLYNLAGNVWEWTSDAFSVRSVSAAAKKRNTAARSGRERVLKGGSFLCHVSHCYRYRIAARLGLPPDTSASNSGFRVAFN
ncbi:formylglycine-generating enzyme family protein [Oceanibium sediminis]|uniref:formylglycine-generating enzyme family protein n=1 Tax=Oceanibium sediminis TaxID=2026339 RepID=UPI000DD2C171|nr:formylglycine-generating enzyme family protein [Oceanibium sediminis]